MTEAENVREKIGWYRWVICALLFFATTINYIDRQVLGVLKKTLVDDLGWNQIDYSNVVASFQTAYAIGLILMGRITDRIGVRLGLIVAVALWSLAAMAHGFVGYVPRAAVCTFSIPAWLPLTGGSVITMAATVVGFGAARFFLGFAEAGNFPASIRAVSEWFPKKERAFATGIFNSGTNIGAIVTPLIVPWIVIRFGWPAAFYVTGMIGFVWLFFWIAMYKSPEHHSRVSPRELAYIRSDVEKPAKKLPWIKLFGCRQTWGFSLAKFLTDPIWWFYLFWIPGFLQEKHGLQILQIGMPLVVIYLLADIGSIGGGWLSSSLIKRGWSINAARKTTMLICALSVIPVLFASRVQNMWVAVCLIGLAASSHAGFSANLFTIVSDTVPRHTVSSIVGIGGMAGAVGGILIAKVVGYILQWTNNNYTIPFLIASSAYLVALLILHLILPRLQPMVSESLEPE
ncbi:MAG: MFS transporter [Kiritimatiellae bacterium]|nr:MFS transporter [Kiritimatiellia bacterium]MDD5520939.1 MFS transporter [Kiritimatiellia bacterium]